MASIPDTATSDGFGSRRKHAVVIQKSMKVSLLKTKRRGGGRSADAALDVPQAKALVQLLGKYFVRLLLDSNRRRALREACTAGLQMERPCGFFEFAEQAVLANLFWGVEGVEKAIHCRTREAKIRRLQSAEQMLQVPALLDEHGTTAGVRNSRIIASAYLNLALVWKLRRNDSQMALHLLQAFMVSPRYLRLELAPDLWEQLFRSHVTALEARRFENSCELLQLKKGSTEDLEILHENALDKITVQRAKYYKDWLIYQSVVAGEKIDDDQKPGTHRAPASSEDDVDGLKDGDAGFQVQISKSLHGATFGTSCSLKPSKQEICLQHMNANDTFLGIHVGKHSVPETSPKATILGHEGRVTSFQAHVTHNKKQDGVKLSPSLRMDNQKASISKSSGFRRLKSKKVADPKRLGDILREPQSDMNMSADSCISSNDEDTNLEEITGYLGQEHEEEKPKIKAVACISATDTLTTVPIENTRLAIHSGRRSYENNNGLLNCKWISPTEAANIVCSSFNQQFVDSISMETGENHKYDSILQDLSSGQNLSFLTEKQIDKSTIVHMARQLLDDHKLERLDSFSPNRSSPPAVGEQHAIHDKIPIFIGDAFFDAQLSKSLSHYDNAENQVAKSVRRKLDFSDNVRGYKAGNVKTSETTDKLVQMISLLCTADELSKKEAAVLAMTSMWEDLKSQIEAESTLVRPAVVDQLTKILWTSKIKAVLKDCVCILSILILKDEFVRHHIFKADPQLYFVTAILKRRKVYEAAVLLYLLNLSAAQMKNLKLLPVLVEVMYNGNHYVDGPISLPWTPRTVALMMIEMLVTRFDKLTNNSHLKTIICLEALPGLVDTLRSGNMEEILAATSVLIQCMRSDGICRHFLSQGNLVASIVQLLNSNDERCRSVSMQFISEAICLPRKSHVVNLLHQIQGEGVFNSMHILMAYIQQVPLEHQPLPAGLLLKLDILAESQRQSIFREEAVDVLLAALSCEESINAQISSASVLANLGGYFTCTGESSMVAWLVKKAGASIAHHRHITGSLGSLDGGLMEEDNDTDCWSRKIAKNVMLSGSHVFEALKRGLQSKVSQVARDSLVAVAWLGCEITEMRKNCLRADACNIVLPEIINFIQPGRELEERVIASLSLYNYTAGTGIKQLMKFSNELHGSLRRLAAFTWTAEKLLKIIAYSYPFEVNIAWDHSQVIEISDIASETTLALLHYNGTLYSGHSDGCIKVWDVKKMSSQIVQKVRVHRKSVTCFALCKTGNRLLSGSADKTVRIWNVTQKKLECMKVLELKEPVHRLDIYGPMVLIVTRSSGVKIHHGDGIVKVLNENKHVQSLIVADDKIYCGCKDSSIQELSVASSQAKEIQGPTRTWLGNRPVYAIVPFRDWLYTAGALDGGFSLKVWRRQEGALLAMVSTGSDVQAIAVTEDFVCLSCSATPNILQIWLREKLEKVTSLTLGSRITSLLAANDIIFCGTENGTIKAWIPP